MMARLRTYLLVTNVLLLLTPMTARSAASDRKAPKIILYAQTYWNAWTWPPAVSLDPIQPPITIKGKRYESCAEMTKDLEGEPMTYQFQIENPDLNCTYITVYSNIQRPKSALFPKRKIEKDVFKNLDLDSMPWKFQYKDNKPHKVENIIGIKEVTVEYGSITISLFDYDSPKHEYYSIFIVASADNIGDGTQQLLVRTLRSFNKTSRENAYFLLTRDVPGGPIRAQPARFRPQAYCYAPKRLQYQAILIDDEPPHR